MKKPQWNISKLNSETYKERFKHHDQLQLVPGTQGWLNIQKSSNVIWHINRIMENPHELPDVQAGFRKGRGTRYQNANIHWIIKKATELPKAFCCVDHNKLWKILQFSSVAQSCLTLWDPMDCSTPGLPVHHQLLEFTQNSCPLSPWCHLNISPCHPLLLLSSVFPKIRVFSNESLFASGGQSIEISVSASSSQWIFRTDFF